MKQISFKVGDTVTPVRNFFGEDGVVYSFTSRVRVTSSNVRFLNKHSDKFRKAANDSRRR